MAASLLVEDWYDSSVIDSMQYVDGVLTITLPTHLGTYYLSHRWETYSALLAHNRPSRLVLDAQQVTYCDGAGAHFLIELQAHQAARHGKVDMQGLSTSVQALVDIIQQLPQPKPLPTLPPTVFLVQLGQYVIHRLQLMITWVVFLGRIISHFGGLLRNPRTFPWKDTWEVFDSVGPGAFFVLALMGLILGLILGFEGTIALRQFGAQTFVPNLVGISLVRELAPLMTAIVLIGRSGSAFAAEIGSMTINQEIDALQTMVIDPIRYLIIPRVLAAMVLMPFMTLIMIFFGLIGCAVVMNLLDYSMVFYIKQLESALSVNDFMIGLFKTLFFGLFAGMIGCFWGLSTRMGASAVGKAATGAVVVGVVTIIILDGLFGIVVYMVGSS